MALSLFAVMQRVVFQIIVGDCGESRQSNYACCIDFNETSVLCAKLLMDDNCKWTYVLRNNVICFVNSNGGSNKSWPGGR